MTQYWSMLLLNGSFSFSFDKMLTNIYSTLIRLSYCHLTKSLQLILNVSVLSLQYWAHLKYWRY